MGWWKYSNKMKLKHWLPTYKSLMILHRTTQRRWTSLCCSAFKKLQSMHWFKKLLVLNAVGMIHCIAPIVYPYNEVVFVSMSVSIGCEDRNWFVFLNIMKLRQRVLPSNHITYWRKFYSRDLDVWPHSWYKCCGDDFGTLQECIHHFIIW